MVNRKELRKLLPHGYGKVIAQKAGVGPNSVSLYFKGKFNSHKIEKAVLDTVAELEQDKKSKMNLIYGSSSN